MKNSLINDYLKLLKRSTLNNPMLLYGDERQTTEINKILAEGLSILCCILVLFAIISETLDIQFKITIPFPFSQQILFILGVICFYCSIKLLKTGVLVANTFVVCFSGITFPSFLISKIPQVLFKQYDLFTSIIGLIIIPATILFLYHIVNKVYNKGISRIEDKIE